MYVYTGEHAGVCVYLCVRVRVCFVCNVLSAFILLTFLFEKKRIMTNWIETFIYLLNNRNASFRENKSIT